MVPETSSALTAILWMGVVVYLTRIGGYAIGLQVRHIGWLRPVLEALPGCAMMALLVPAVADGSVVDLIALLSVVVIMWCFNSIVVATIVGIAILLYGSQMLAMIAG